MANMLTPVTDAHLEALKKELSPNVFGADPSRYTEDPRRHLSAQVAPVLRPTNTDEVARIVRFAGAHHLGLIPFGGGTGLVGAQLSTSGPLPLILSLERMNRVRSVHPRENILIVEAGMTLAEVQTAADEADRLFPLSLASEGTARIGGNLATNAGGVQVLRYGNARDLCLGLEAVLPNGEVWRGLKRLRKDNTGYDLRNLLIGSEGTLGVITAAALRLFPKPHTHETALIAVPDPDAALDLLALAQEQLGQGVTAFELISRSGFELLGETGLPGGDLLAGPPPWAVLMEVSLPGAHARGDHLEEIFAIAFERGFATDGIIASSETQRRELWAMRENMPTANARIGSIASHDIAVPLENIAGLISESRDALTRLGEFRINAFGHLGDGNIHLNVFPAKGKTRDDYPGMARKVTSLIYDLTDRHGGTFSAEHGIGRIKIDELERFGDPAKLTALRAIKRALDPLGIMNPGAVLKLPD